MKILVLFKQLLFPRDTGPRIRTIHLLKHLAKWHDVTFLCNIRPGEESHRTETASLGLNVIAEPWQAPTWGGLAFYASAATNLLSTRPYSVNRNYDPRLRERLSTLLNKESYDLLICHSPQMALHTHVDSLPASVLFAHNVESQILRRHADKSASWARRWYMRRDYEKMLEFERQEGARFDAVVAVSPDDKRLFESQYGWKHVRNIDTAVDEDYFEENADQGTKEVLFVGSMDWLPNQDGVEWMADKVWPLVRKEHPQAVFRVVGRNPPRNVTRLAESAGIEILGGVPDIRPYLKTAAVCVVPLLVGGGTRLKMYEYMVTGRPVVSTSIGAEGLPIEPGKHWVRADGETEFAVAINELLSHAERRNEIGLAGSRFVRERYSSFAIAKQYEGILQEVVENKRKTK